MIEEITLDKLCKVAEILNKYRFLDNDTWHLGCDLSEEWSIFTSDCPLKTGWEFIDNCTAIEIAAYLEKLVYTERAKAIEEYKAEEARKRVEY